MKFLYILLISILFYSCNEQTTQNIKTKEPILLADREAPLGWVYLRIYEDSTFEFENRGGRQTNIYSGKASIVSDSIFFNYSDSIPRAGQTAIYSNNYVAFIDGEYPERIQVKMTKLDSVKTINTLDTLLNTSDYLVLGNKKAKIKIVQEDEIEQHPNYNVLIGYGNDFIIGEEIEFKEVKIYKKYTPKTSFDDYKVQIYDGKLADPDFSTNPEAKLFITRIKTECEKGINFAGHFTLVIWGCGSSCQNGVIVDRITGKIHLVYGTSLGSKFKKDSKMIITNVAAIDTTTNLIETCGYCNVKHEIWTGTKFIVVE